MLHYLLGISYQFGELVLHEDIAGGGVPTNGRNGLKVIER